MSHDDVKGHARIYLMVFFALMIGTIVTVAIASFHLSVPLAITIALIIACTKGSLVALYFMHLSNEQKAIYSALLLTVVFWIFLMFIPLLTQKDTIGKPIVHPVAAGAEHH